MMGVESGGKVKNKVTGASRVTLPSVFSCACLCLCVCVHACWCGLKSQACGEPPPVRVKMRSQSQPRGRAWPSDRRTRGAREEVRLGKPAKLTPVYWGLEGGGGGGARRSRKGGIVDAARPSVSALPCAFSCGELLGGQEHQKEEARGICNDSQYLKSRKKEKCV